MPSAFRCTFGAGRRGFTIAEAVIALGIALVVIVALMLFFVLATRIGKNVFSQQKALAFVPKTGQRQMGE